MILSPGRIDVSRTLSALRLFAELGYVEEPQAGTALGADSGRELLNEGPTVFTEYVEDNVEHENDIRRGLCWLLNQPNDVLADILEKARMPFPRRDITQRRRYLESLWDAAFASWRVARLDPHDHEVVGLPS